MVVQVNEGLLSNYLKKIRFNTAIRYCEGKILDFGCGDGSFCENFMVENYNGYEPDYQSFELAKKKFPKNSFFNDLNSINQKFDSIVLLALIEHVDNPHDFLINLSNRFVKNSNSKIIITTPNKYLDFFHHLGASLGLFSSHAADEHNVMFNKKDLFKLAKETNHRVINYKKFLFFANQIIVLSKIEK